MNRHPETVEDAFTASRRRFVPRLLMVFALYAGLVYAPDIRELVEDALPNGNGGEGVSVTVPPTVASPSVSPPSPPATGDGFVVPVRTGTGWELDQPEFTGHLILGRPGETGQFSRLVQTFRAPAQGTRVVGAGIHVRFASGPLSISLLEFRGLTPAGARVLDSGVIPQIQLPVEALLEVTFTPAVPVKAGRTYAIAVAPADPSGQIWLGHLRRDVYRLGRVWTDDGGGWARAEGELAFRLEFEQP